MNVYDFDRTIYGGDSSVDFYFYCLKKRPRIVVYGLRQAWGVCLRALGRIGTGTMKERFFSFLAGLRDAEALAESFWEERGPEIGGWYLERKEAEDVVISASPEFLLAPACRRLGIRPPVATRMDPSSGRIQGRNCKGEEKVRRFLEQFPDGKIERFYSDSLTDAPLAELAEEAFLVKGGKITPWGGEPPITKEKTARIPVRRESNMELLRIVSMFMIIVFHCTIKSGFQIQAGFSVNKLILKCFWMLGELGVNLFMLISGYYMAKGRFKWKKLVRLLVEVQVYHWGILWLGSRLGVCELVGRKAHFLAFFPVITNQYWFVTAYLLVYILSPFFNLLIGAMDQKTYRRFLAVALGLFCVIPTFFGFFYNTTESLLYYNRMIWLSIMYFLGAYIYIYMQKDEKQKENRRKYVTLTLCSAAVMAVSILIIDRFIGFFAAVGTTECAYFWPPNTIPMVFLSVGVFGLFRSLRLSYHPAVNALASTTMGVYMLHDGRLVPWIWRSVFCCAAYQDSPYLAFRILGAAAAVFAAGAAVDLLRGALEKHTLDRVLARF